MNARTPKPPHLAAAIEASRTRARLTAPEVAEQLHPTQEQMDWLDRLASGEYVRGDMVALQALKFKIEMTIPKPEQRINMALGVCQIVDPYALPPPDPQAHALPGAAAPCLPVHARAQGAGGEGVRVLARPPIRRPRGEGRPGVAPAARQTVDAQPAGSTPVPPESGAGQRGDLDADIFSDLEGSTLSEEVK